MSSQRKLFVGATLCLALLIATESYAQEEMTPIRINITVLNSQGGNNQCPSTEERERGLNEMNEQVRSILSDYTTSEEEVCGGPGWRQVAFIDMTNTSYDCPPGLNLTSYSKRTCGRSNTAGRSCSRTTFNTGGSQYSKVCGRIKAYQWGYGWGLYNHHTLRQGIDGDYVDGLSLTHGISGNRAHIWTFIAAIYENSGYPESECPCDVNHAYPVPSFIGSDYFCESATRQLSNFVQDFYPNNPLWDGRNCGESGNTCCRENNPPWFKKDLGVPTADDIELRMCYWGQFGYTDIPIELIEMYVQ